MTTADERILPVLESESAFFWLSGKDGVLRIQRCDACQRWQHPPLPLCPTCHGAALTAQPVSGRGRVKTFTINHQPWKPGMTVPFIFAAIELEEQAELYVLSNVLDAIDRIRIGMAVEVCFQRHEDVWIPLFKPTADSGVDDRQVRAS